jgi:hypothetical protein
MHFRTLPRLGRGLSLSIPILALALAAALGGHADAAPIRQAGPVTCAWNPQPAQTTQGMYFAASAYDENNDKIYYYGGVNQIGEVSNDLTVLDLTDPDISKASFSTPAISGSQLQRYGMSGSFRPKGDKSAAYFIGGASPDGGGTTDVNILTIKTGTWRKVVPQGSKQRLFGASVYIPIHDVILVQGGTRSCPLNAADRRTGDCEADNLGSQFLVFDDMTDDMHYVNGPNGGPQNLAGLTVVYDNRARRVLAFGGSRDNNLADNRVYELDVSDPDLGKASWRTLSVDGTPPKARYFHAAAFDSQRNRMVIQGGATQAALGDNEKVIDDSHALDLSGATPRWENLGAGYRDLVGANMDYGILTRSVVLVGGRARFKARSAAQTTFRDASALICGIAPTPVPEPTRPVVDPGQPKVCDYIGRRVPAAVINDAVANATNVRGFGEPLNPGLPPGPSNPLKTYLGLQNPAVPYHPLFNAVAYKVGCP